MEKSTITAAVSFVALALLHGGCFSPDYGAGGFTCAQGKCPSGYECQNGVCRKSGTTVSDSSVDGPVKDVSPPADSKPDGPSADTGKPDVKLADGAPDTKPVSDIKPTPDTKPLSDLVQPPDAPTPSICSLSKVASPIKITMQPFDLALDGKAKPHIVYVDSASALVHASNPPTWVKVKGATNVDRLAGDFENPNTGVDILHVIFREVGTTTKLHHTYRSLGVSSIPWAKPTLIPNSPDVFYADIGAMAGDIFIVAGGYTTFAGGAYKPILNRWQVKPGGTAGYTFTSLGNMQSNEFQHVRVDVAKAGWGHTAWNKTSFATFWRTEANGSFTDARSVANANATSSPAAVALDFKGNYHHVFVRSGALTDTLYYGFWSGLGTSAVMEQKIFVGKVHPASVDIAVHSGLPYVTYARATANPVTYLSHMDSTNTWHHYKMGNTSKPSPYSRAALEVDATGAVILHGVYLDGGALIYAKCPVP